MICTLTIQTFLWRCINIERINSAKTCYRCPRVSFLLFFCGNYVNAPPTSTYYIKLCLITVPVDFNSYSPREQWDTRMLRLGNQCIQKKICFSMNAVQEWPRKCVLSSSFARVAPNRVRQKWQCGPQDLYRQNISPYYRDNTEWEMEILKQQIS